MKQRTIATIVARGSITKNIKLSKNATKGGIISRKYLIQYKCSNGNTYSTVNIRFALNLNCLVLLNEISVILLYTTEIADITITNLNRLTKNSNIYSKYFWFVNCTKFSNLTK